MVSNKLAKGGGGVSLPTLLAGVALRRREDGVYSRVAKAFFPAVEPGVFDADRANGDACCC